MSGDDVAGAGQRRGGRKVGAGAGEMPPVRGLPCVVTRASVDRTGRGQPRPSGRDKPGDRAEESQNRGEPSVPGLAD